MIVHRPIPEDMSVKAFKKVLEGPTQREREDEEAKRKKLQVRKSSYGLKSKGLGLYSQHFMFFINYKMLECQITQDWKNNWGKHPSLLDLLATYWENEVLWMQSPGLNSQNIFSPFLPLANGIGI